MIVLRLPSPFSSSSLTAARSPSSKIGSETTYFSLAQLPRSRRRQRSLQKGKSACTAESVGALQIGHLCIMTVLFLRSETKIQRFVGPNDPGNNVSVRVYPKTRSGAPVAMRCSFLAGSADGIESPASLVRAVERGRILTT